LFSREETDVVKKELNSLVSQLSLADDSFENQNDVKISLQAPKLLDRATTNTKKKVERESKRKERIGIDRR